MTKCKKEIKDHVERGALFLKGHVSSDFVVLTIPERIRFRGMF